MSQKLNLDISMGEFVELYPQSREIFNAFDLDYCCKGDKNIVMAVKEKNIDLNQFESLLQNIVEKTPHTEKYKIWTNESLTDLVNYIEKVHHSLAWEKLHSIDTVLKKLMQVHGEKHGDFLLPLQNMFIELNDKLGAHLKKEETVLFPFVRQLEEPSASRAPETYNAFDSIKGTVKALRKEHEEAGEILTQIKEYTSNYALPEYACASFAKFYSDLETLQDDLHAHIHLENTILFPRLMILMD